MCVLSRVWLFATPWTVGHQAPLSPGFSRQEYWKGLPFPSPGDLPHLGIKPTFPASPALANELYHLGHPYWIRAGPKYESVLIRDREYTEKRFIRRQRQRTEGYCHKPGEKLEPPEAERGRIFPRNFRRNVILLIPVSWASRPQLWETINFCCFKPCNLWSFVTEARKIDKGVWSLVSFTSLNSC